MQELLLQTIFQKRRGDVIALHRSLTFTVPAVASDTLCHGVQVLAGMKLVFSMAPLIILCFGSVLGLGLAFGAA